MRRTGASALAVITGVLLTGCGDPNSPRFQASVQSSADAAAGDMGAAAEGFAALVVVGVATVAIIVDAASTSRERLVYEYPNGPLLEDGAPAYFWIQHNTKAYDLDENVHDRQWFSFMNLETRERWGVRWLQWKTDRSKRRLKLPGALERQGETYTNWIVSLEPLVVVTTRGETLPSDGSMVRWVADGSYVSADSDPYVLVHSLDEDRLLLDAGLVASHILDDERPIRWYSPTRKIAPRVIEDDGGDMIELDTGRERFIINRIEGRWVVQRASE